MPDFLCAALTEHLDSQVEAAQDALLFTGRTGKPHDYNAFRRSIWDPATTAAGLDGVTPHALRATCATWVEASIGATPQGSEHPLRRNASSWSATPRSRPQARTSVTTRHYARPVQVADSAGVLEAARRLGQDG